MKNITGENVDLCGSTIVGVYYAHGSITSMRLKTPDGKQEYVTFGVRPVLQSVDRAKVYDSYKDADTCDYQESGTS